MLVWAVSAEEIQKGKVCLLLTNIQSPFFSHFSDMSEKYIYLRESKLYLKLQGRLLISLMLDQLW